VSFVQLQAELSSIKSSLSLGAEHQGLGWQEDMNSHLVPAVPPRTVKVMLFDKHTHTQMCFVSGSACLLSL
jgi:hypothetical protein